MRTKTELTMKPALFAVLAYFSASMASSEEPKQSSLDTAQRSASESIQIVYKPITPGSGSEKGTLVLYRPFKFANMAGSPNVMVNDTLIGELRNNRFIELSVPPGEYLITPLQDEWWNIPCGNIHATVKAKSTTYVRMDSSAVISDVLFVNGGIVSASSNDKCWIDLVEQAEAETQLKKVKRATEKQRRPHVKD